MALFSPSSKTPGTPASHIDRFIASLLDGFILISITAPITLVSGGPTIASVVLSFFALIAYFTFSHASKWQATPGKRIMYLYVADKKLQPITYRRSLERALAYYIPFLLQYSSLSEQTIASVTLWLLLIWFIPIFYTVQRTGLHDILCHTRVLNGRVGE